jgi:hypothetical protein
MVSSVDSKSSKKNDGVPRPAADRIRTPGFFTDEALLRLEAGLRAQREQSSRPENSSALRDRLSQGARIEPISEVDHLARGGEEPAIRDEEPVPLPYWRRRQGVLLLCALLLVAGAATLRVSLNTRTGASTHDGPVNIESRGQTLAPGKGAPLNTLKSSAATPSLPPSPARPNEQRVEAHGPPGVSGTLVPPNEHPVEAQGSATPAVSGTPVPPNEHPVEAQGSSTPAASGTPAPKPKCNIAACSRVYRSFRASDCTFLPRHSHGKRRICDR